MRLLISMLLTVGIVTLVGFVALVIWETSRDR